MSPTRRLALLCLPTMVVAAAAGGADVGRGAQLYERECSKCHGQVSALGPEVLDARLLRVAGVAVNDSREPLAFAMPYGPSLRGVVGRRAGTVPGFEYSKSFLSELGGVVWNEASLDVFITDSQRRVPGARMFYRQPDPDVRRAIIGYLAASP